MREAFEVNAVDYLLKPFDRKRVAQAIQKAGSSRKRARCRRKDRSRGG